MHCHDILDITETASLAEIEERYSKKAQALFSSRNLMSDDAYALKMNELETAQAECISWSNHSNPDKMKLRMQQAKPQSKQSTRLYSVCFGPCTCTDMCCGSACDGSSVSPSFCEHTTGSQTCPIVCDIIIWAPGEIYVGFHIIRFLYEAISDAVRNHAQAKADRIRARISNLRSQLSATVQKRAALEQQLGPESERLNYLSAFATAFTRMGVRDTAAITNAQDIKVRELRNQILECHDRNEHCRQKSEPTNKVYNINSYFWRCSNCTATMC